MSGTMLSLSLQEAKSGAPMAHLRRTTAKALCRALDTSLRSLSSAVANKDRDYHHDFGGASTNVGVAAGVSDDCPAKCDLGIVKSPYPSISIPEPCVPVPNFVSSKWTTPQIRERTAIVDACTGEQRTFHDYHIYSSRVADVLLHDLNVGMGSTVTIFSPNHVDYVPIAVAASICGARLALVNPLYGVSTFSKMLETSKSSVLICHAETMDVAVAAAHSSRRVKQILVIPSTERDVNLPHGVSRLLDGNSLETPSNTRESSLEHEEHKIKREHINHESEFAVLQTLGTTGPPKGVVLSHVNAVSSLLQMEEVEAMSFPMNHKLLAPVPFCYPFGFFMSALYAAWRGAEVVTVPSSPSHHFDMEELCRVVENHRPDRAHLASTTLKLLALSQATQKYDLSSLRTVVSSGGPLLPNVETQAMTKLDCHVKQTWQMTELSCLGAINYDYATKVGSVGPLAPSSHAKVVDPATGQTLGPDQMGEILVKGPQVMLGYLSDTDPSMAESLDTSSFDGGWLRTGDMGCYDEDGYFFVRRRRIDDWGIAGEFQ